MINELLEENIQDERLRIYYKILLKKVDRWRGFPEFVPNIPVESYIFEVLRIIQFIYENTKELPYGLATDDGILLRYPSKGKWFINIWMLDGSVMVRYSLIMNPENCGVVGSDATLSNILRLIRNLEERYAGA